MRRTAMVLALLSMTWPSAPAAAQDFEQPPEFKASEILTPDLLNGDHHRVIEQVTNDGYHNIYEIWSDFGPFTAYGSPMLRMRITEIEAIGQLQDLSQTEVFLESAANTTVSGFRAIWQAATNPIETIAGLPEGIIRIFHDYEEDIVDGAGTASDITGIGKEDSGGEGEDDGYTEDEITKAFEIHLGVRSAQRRRARELGVDPYTSNEPLQSALNEIARIERAARYGMKLVPLPSIPGVGYIETAVEAVWTKDYRELQKFNRERLIESGVAEADLDEFFRHPDVSPTLQTIIVSGLLELDDVENRDQVIRQANSVRSEDEAYFFTESLSLLVWFHNNQSPLVRFLPDVHLPVGLTADRRQIAMFPVDYMAWTPGIAAAAKIYTLESADYPIDDRELWLLGDASPRARQGLAALGWQVKEDVATEIDWAPHLQLD
ncbi:MAG: hypothetical protein GY791_05450 [Alphaproteobacteria bacterium]|nr:hypothetical protein [Alphaproteobacteria bacterium]